jgi:uncharacterized membrane protein
MLFTCLTLALTIIVFLLPTGFGPGAGNSHLSSRVKAVVTEADNALIKIIGPVKQGEQLLTIRIVSGPFKGSLFSSSNNLMGKMELDKMFAPGDSVLAVLDLSADGTEVVYANVTDHYRTDKTLILAGLFFLFLLVLFGWVGLRVMISFVFTGAVVIRVLLPAMLRGWDPIAATLLITALLTGVIVLLVGGLNRTGLTAFVGAIGGVGLTALLAFSFTQWFHIHGAVRPFSEALIYSGYAHLNLVHLFVAGIFLASSGAVMDLAIDISVAMNEVKIHHPDITRLELIKSGFRVARHVTGTMTTTLLLAYSAEYTAMCMTFIAQGIPFENIINLVYVSSEVVHTLVGSFGLILVAPLTAVAGGFLMVGRK